MDLAARDLTLALGGAALGGLAVHLVARRVGAALRSRRAQVRSTRAALGERRAVALLEAHGYTVVDAQVGASYEVHVDGRTVVVELRCDYVVRRGGRRLVAEVKTGALAPRIETAATRRQLLEYRVAFDVDGVLLVDVEAGRVHVVAFAPAPAAHERVWGVRALAWLLAMALACGLARHFGVV